jgi:UMF1 family MFS transporter
MTTPGDGVSSRSSVGEPSTGKKVVWGWALYDFGNSAFFTVILTFTYAVFFAEEIVPDGTIGSVVWATGVTVSGLIVAVSSPFLGALADRGGHRRRYLFITTAVAVLGTALLYFPTPGEVRLALVIFVIANVAAELASGVFYNSYLPEISTPDNIGKISGYGWSLGYLGGLLVLGITLVGFVFPDSPWFGLSTGEEGLFQNIRATTVVAAVWFAVFAIPMFLWVPEPEHPRAPPLGELLRGTVSQLGNTFKHIQRYGQIARLLFARMIYNDGLGIIFAIGVIYTVEVFGFTITQAMMFGLAINVTAGLGAFAMGFLDDRIGGKKTILISLVGLTLAVLWATLAPAESTTSLYMAGLAIGIFMGPNQAASRSLLGRFVPQEKETEFYGFFAFSGKATAFLGPTIYGVMTTAFGNPRYGVGAIMVFFLVGGLILATVDEVAGVAASGRASAS